MHNIPALEVERSFYTIILHWSTPLFSASVNKQPKLARPSTVVGTKSHKLASFEWNSARVCLRLRLSLLNREALKSPDDSIPLKITPNVSHFWFLLITTLAQRRACGSARGPHSHLGWLIGRAHASLCFIFYLSSELH